MSRRRRRRDVRSRGEGVIGSSVNGRLTHVGAFLCGNSWPGATPHSRVRSHEPAGLARRRRHDSPPTTTGLIFAWCCTLINGGSHKIQSPRKMLGD
jgi:hypothetical protein